MRVVNLSRRPFLNRRPVARIATLLWTLGVLLLLLNLWLFSAYLSGTTKNRERLAELNAEIDAAEQEFDAVGKRLSQVELGERNQRAVFLNDLIDQRTFPWSRLFDDLEDALHKDVYLTLVAPSVESEQPETRSRATPNRRITPREARERARRRQSQGGSATSSSMPTPESANVEAESEVEVVTLNLQGNARTDEALLDFVDALYEYESFVDPFLSTEAPDESTRSIRFTIAVYYLLPRRTARPADDLASSVAGSGEAVAASGSDSDGAQDDTQGRASDDVPVVEVDDPDAPGRARDDVAEDARDAGTRRPGAAPTRPQASANGASEARRTEPPATTSGRDRDLGRDDERGRSRQDIEEDLARQIEERNNRRRRPASRDRRSTDENGREPELTEPAASASPSLRRIGR